MIIAQGVMGAFVGEGGPITQGTTSSLTYKVYLKHCSIIEVLISYHSNCLKITYNFFLQPIMNLVPSPFVFGHINKQ